MKGRKIWKTNLALPAPRTDEQLLLAAKIAFHTKLLS
jgi:hypothetical protein